MVCPKCGKELKEKEVCSCEKSILDKIDEAVDRVVPDEKVNSIFDRFVKVIKKIYFRPCDAVKKFSNKKSFVLSIIAIGINTFIFSFLAFFIAKIIMSFIPPQDMFYLSLTGYKMGFMSTFLAGLISINLFFAVLIGIMFFTSNIIFKTKIDIREIVSIVGISSIYVIPIILTALITSYILPGVTFIVILSAFISLYVLIYEGFRSKERVSNNKLFYMMMPAYSVATAIAYFTMISIMF